MFLREVKQMKKLLDMDTISQVDVVETLRKFVYEDLSADIANDTAFMFASELTGLSIDTLSEYIFE